MVRFSVLSGLPTYGPPAKTFSATGWGLHSEGYVVEFELPDGSKWTGNFIGTLSGVSTATPHPDGISIVVVANGEGYIVDPINQKLLHAFGGQICDLIHDKANNTLLFSNGIWLECLGKNGLLWKTKRVSWDGIKNLTIHADLIKGEAYDPMTDQWVPFEIDKCSGDVKGGSYNGPS